MKMRPPHPWLMMAPINTCITRSRNYRKKQIDACGNECNEHDCIIYDLDNSQTAGAAKTPAFNFKASLNQDIPSVPTARPARCT